jgi:hypothetical protein
MYKDVTETLKQRSQAICADAIVVLNEDIGEISGKVSHMQGHYVGKFLQLIR